MSSEKHSELKDKLINLIEVTNELNPLLKDLNIVAKFSEVKEQIGSVTKTISELERKHIPVPPDLRRLKADLVVEFSELEDINKLIAEFVFAFSKLNNNNEIVILKTPEKPITQKVNKGPRTRNTPLTSIQLKDLIEDKILLPNTKLIHKGRYDTFTAFINSSGQIVVQMNGVNKYFDSPSSAAESLTGGSINGWDWWFVQKDGRVIKLNVFREKYSDKYKT